MDYQVLDLIMAEQNQTCGVLRFDYRTALEKFHQRSGYLLFDCKIVLENFTE